MSDGLKRRNYQTYRTAIYQHRRIHRYVGTAPDALTAKMRARLLQGSVIAVAPRCMCLRLVDVHLHAAIAAVVLRIARVVAQQILAAQVAAELLHGVRQVLEFAHTD